MAQNEDVQEARKRILAASAVKDEAYNDIEKTLARFPKRDGVPVPSDEGRAVLKVKKNAFQVAIERWLTAYHDACVTFISGGYSSPEAFEEFFREEIIHLCELKGPHREFLGSSDSSDYPKIWTVYELLKPNKNLNHIEGRIALALSGGGFRATLFHLGVITFLKESGLLPQVKVISSVSGGSIIAAHMVANWKSYLEGDIFQASAPLREALKEGFRGPHDLADPSEEFPQFLESRLFSLNNTYKITLRDLPAEPALAILSTEISKISRVWFGHKGGRAVPVRSNNLPEGTLVAPPSLSLARAVAASAAFPIFFSPIRLNNSHANAVAADDDILLCADGGVLDNTGLQHLSEIQEQFDWVVLSDAGQILRHVTPAKVSDAITGGKRSLDVGLDSIREFVLEQARRLWPTRFIHIDIRGASEALSRRGYDIKLAIEIAKVRTDLDPFPEALQQTILHHGYAAAETLLEQYNLIVKKVSPWSVKPPMEDTNASRLLTEASSRTYGLGVVARALQPLAEITSESRRGRTLVALIVGILLGLLAMWLSLRMTKSTINRDRNPLPTSSALAPSSSASYSTTPPSPEEKRKAEDAKTRLQTISGIGWQSSIRVLLKARMPVEVPVNGGIAADPCETMARFESKQPVLQDVLDACRNADVLQAIEQIRKLDDQTKPAQKYPPFRPQNTLTYQALNLLFHQLTERDIASRKQLNPPSLSFNHQRDPGEIVAEALNEARLNCRISAATMEPIVRRAQFLSTLEQDAMGYSGAFVFAQEGQPPPEPARTNTWAWLFDLTIKIPEIPLDSFHAKRPLTILMLSHALREQYSKLQHDISALTDSCEKISSGKP